MKKLKLTINGEVKIFDLPENGDYKCEVTESYVPKEGDCVMMKNKELNVIYWCKITDITTTLVDFKLSVNNRLEISKKGSFKISENRIYTQITPEELKAKYAEAGYDWDYETDTIKPIKWSPKDGEKIWWVNSIFEPIKHIFNKDNTSFQLMLKKGLLFKTEEECQKFTDHCMKYINKNK